MIQGVVAQLFFIVLMAMSFYAIYQVDIHYKTGLYIKWLNVILFVLTIYGSILIINGNSFYKHGYVSHELNNYAYLQLIYRSVLPIYAFYYYTLKRQITSNNLFVFFLIILICYILMFYQSFWGHTNVSGKENYVNNMGFLFVPLIPMLYILRIRDIWKYLFAAVIFLFILMSMKRGAILTGGVMLLFFIVRHLKVTSPKQIIYIISLTVVVLYFIYTQVMDLYLNNTFFYDRLMLTLEGYSSGRDELYGFFLNYYLDRTSWTEFLFGHGAYGTVALYGNAAHNDWLEFAINQGLIGVMLYLIYWIVFIWEWKEYKGIKENRQALGDIIVAYFLIALFSMSFANMPIYATLCIGYCLAMGQIKVKSMKQWSPR